MDQKACGVYIYTYIYIHTHNIHGLWGHYAKWNNWTEKDSEYLTCMQNLENNNPNSGKEAICGYHKWSVGEGTTG